MAYDDSKLAALGDLGQSVWLDFISRDLLRSGGLGARVAQGVAGMTTNPTIFDKAIGRGASYDEQIQELADAAGRRPAIVDALIVADVQEACDLLRPVYDAHGPRRRLRLHRGAAGARLRHGQDGRRGPAPAARRRAAQPHGEDPGHAAGPGGHPPDGRRRPQHQHHAAVRDRRLRAGGRRLPRRPRGPRRARRADRRACARWRASSCRGSTPRPTARSTSSSPPRATTRVRSRLEGLRGTLGVANAKLAYRRFLEIASSERWHRLAERGAHAQRCCGRAPAPRIPDYDDLLYVDNLIGPQTVNTMPEETLQAFLDHGVVRRTVDQGADEAHDRVEQAARLGHRREGDHRRAAGRGRGPVSRLVRRAAGERRAQACRAADRRARRRMSA